jgi:hypothetical protein
MAHKEAVPLKLQEATVDAERLGELFLINRENMISNDKQRNSTREALTALRKRHEGAKVWMKQSSNSFERCSTASAIARLEAGGCLAAVTAAADCCCSWPTADALQPPCAWPFCLG